MKYILFVALLATSIGCFSEEITYTTEDVDKYEKMISIYASKDFLHAINYIDTLLAYNYDEMVKLSLLTYKASAYFYLGNYNKSIEIGQELDRISGVETFNSSYLLLRCYTEIGNEAEVEKNYGKLRRQTTDFGNLIFRAAYSYVIGNWALAKNDVDIAFKYWGEDIYILHILNALSMIHLDCQEAAFKSMIRAEKIMNRNEFNELKTKRIPALSLYIQALYHYHAGDINESQKYFTKAYHLYKSYDMIFAYIIFMEFNKEDIAIFNELKQNAGLSDE